MDTIPLYIYFDNLCFLGVLSRVAGAGGQSVYHLLIDNFYFGTLTKTVDWVFHGRVFNDIATELGCFLNFMEIVGG